MTTSPVRVERRVGQRFSYLLPVSIHQASRAIEGVGFTQDLSSKGVFFFTDAPLTGGSEIELTLRMPSEITLGENMLVRCRGRVLRIVHPIPEMTSRPTPFGAETKIGVAVRFDGYEYLSSDAIPNLARVSNIQSHPGDRRPLVHSSARS